MWMSSPGHAEVFAANHGVPAPPVIVNVPSLDPDPRAAGVPDLHAELDLAPGLRIVLYIGGVYPHRPLEALVEAARELEGCAVVIMGPGLPSYMDDVTRARRRARGRGPGAPGPAGPDRRRRPIRGGRGRRVIPFLNTSLNNFHGLPNKIFEYIAAGIPVVASDFPQLRAVIERYDVGAHLRPRRPGALAAAIRARSGRPGATGHVARERGRRGSGAQLGGRVAPAAGDRGRSRRGPEVSTQCAG